MGTRFGGIRLGVGEDQIWGQGQGAARKVLFWPKRKGDAKG